MMIMMVIMVVLMRVTKKLPENIQIVLLLSKSLLTLGICTFGQGPPPVTRAIVTSSISEIHALESLSSVQKLYI